MECSFCGLSFEESESRPSCAGCPMHKVCNKVKCPRCGYEMQKEPALIKFLRKRKVIPHA
ncbi:MAG: hypothetical protein N2376_02635 [Clostridia bacterium]|nr:hypothetical protein [Clostridia bacterium]